jgi:hypothetical protein
MSQAELIYNPIWLILWSKGTSEKGHIRHGLYVKVFQDQREFLKKVT